MIHDIIGIAVVGVGFLLVLASAEIWVRRGNPKPEWTRKLVHFGGGAACLALPWVVRSWWAVLVLAVFSSTLIATGRRTGILRSLNAVKRETLGSEYYPAAIFLIFVISEGRAWLYLSSVLVLAVADAFAALIGLRYGKLRYSVQDREKTIEGSLAFLLVAIVAMVVPMLLLTDFPCSVVGLSAFLVGVLVTGFEAISLRGADNIFVPIAVCAILAKITTKPLTEIIYQNASLACIGSLVSFVAWRVKAFNVGGAIVFILFAYGAWSLGSELWAIPVLVAFLPYAAACVLFPPPVGGGIAVKVRLVYRALLMPLLLLIVANMFKLECALYGPFIGTSATVLALVLWNHVIERRSDMSSRVRLLLSPVIGAVSALVVAAAPAVVLPTVGTSNVVGVMAVVSVAALLNNRATGPVITLPKMWGVAQMGLAGGVGVILLCLQWVGVMDCWF